MDESIYFVVFHTLSVLFVLIQNQESSVVLAD